MNAFANKFGHQPENKIDTEIKQAPADAEPIGESPDAELVAHFTSLPIANYRLGRFEFVNGYLSLNESDAAEFTALVAQQPIAEQVRLKKLPGPPIGANAGVSMVQGIDHTGNIPAAPIPTSA